MLANPTAIVTGGSRGIGRGICIELARHGYAVCVNYQGNRAAAEETQQLLGGVDSFVCQADVSQAEQRSRLVDAVLERWGRIDVLVNNAGITSVGRRDILEATEESWEQVLGINLKGPFFLSQRVAQEMIRVRSEEAPANFQPAIINVSSVSGYAISVNRGDYCVSKSGLAMVTQLFAVRLAEFGIRVFEIRPGIIDTDMTAGAKEKYTQLISDGLTPIRRWGTAEDVGKAVVVLATGTIPYTTGEVLNIDGGYHLRRFP